MVLKTPENYNYTASGHAKILTFFPDYSVWHTSNISLVLPQRQSKPNNHIYFNKNFFVNQDLIEFIL